MSPLTQVQRSGWREGRMGTCSDERKEKPTEYLLCAGPVLSALTTWESVSKCILQVKRVKLGEEL